MAERPTSRRGFLRGESAAEALRSTARNAASQGAPPPPAAATLTLSRKAMACEFQIQLNATAEQNETAAALAALDLIEAVEDRLTVYRPVSEVMAINATAARGPVPVANDLFGLLAFAERLRVDSAGAFDITSGPLSRAWGFSRREGRAPGEVELQEALALVGGDAVQLDFENRTVAFARPGIDINFNSIGKGFALDAASRLLADKGVADCLLHGGRSTLVARGAGGGGESPGWGVGVRHPLRPQQRLAECRLANAAFSTSGSATQCFVHNGKRYGHLIDPRTGWPAEGLHSVSVVAPTGAEADALSTAFYVMGHAAAAEYCREHTNIQALFVLPAAGDNVTVQTENLDDACWRLTPC